MHYPVHQIEMKWDNGQTEVIVKCDNSPPALCKAEFTCECDGWYEPYVNDDGFPVHHDSWPVTEETQQHVGTWVDDCQVRESTSLFWLEENLTGKIEFDVQPEWQKDGWFELQVIPADVDPKRLADLKNS